MCLKPYFYVDQMACEKILDVVSGLVPPNQELTKTSEDQGRLKTKTRKGTTIVQNVGLLLFLRKALTTCTALIM